jgi:RimJ/RimL family protein N-acetyltransferase
VALHIGGKPSTPEEVWSRLLRYAGHWALLGFGYWAVVEKSSGRFVGEAGLADFKRAIEPSLGGAPEAGWALMPWAHGRGYATEALRAVLAWGEERFGSPRAVCIISPENLPSLRVAQKCGFERTSTTTYKGTPTVLFERPGR